MTGAVLLRFPKIELTRQLSRNWPTISEKILSPLLRTFAPGL